jgi:PPOX class probable F420-dependent enzyme
MLDLTTQFGARAARRLDEEIIIWLTTVRADGTPQPSPVWFLRSDQTLLIYSEPNTPKLRNIAQNPKVALNFDGDGRGGNVVIFSGEAHVDPQAPSAAQVAAYVKKYGEHIARIKRTPESFAQAYSVAVRVALLGVRGH